jgi:hypothetical protein
MNWNVNEAFVGELVKPLKKYGQDADEDANLFFSHFLATPLLPIDNALNKEVKFCGNKEICNHKDGVGAVVNAFLHATLIHSHGEVLFSDIQGVDCFVYLTPVSMCLTFRS